jgi:hypothetical protein
MNTNNSPVSVGVEVKEKTPKQPTPRPAYTAPQMFAVGQTVDLINGAKTTGPLDWSSSWPQYDPYAK